MITTVILSERAKRDLRKVPRFIAIKLQEWVEDVEERGVEKVRTIPGYHDEPLQGKLIGYRSIRLSRSYRAYYRIFGKQIQFVSIERVDKHEY